MLNHVIVQVNSLVRKSVISRNDAWVLLTLLALGSSTTKDLAVEVGATERTMQRILSNLKEVNLVGKNDGLWVVKEISSTSNLSETPAVNMSNMDTQYTNIQTKQQTKQEKPLPEKEIAASIPSADLTYAAEIFGQPWIAPHLEKIVLQVLAGRPYFPEPFFDAVKHTVNEVRHPENRQRRGLQPVRNPFGFFRVVFANMYENYRSNCEIAATAEFAQYAAAEVCATVDNNVAAPASPESSGEEVPVNPDAETKWAEVLAKIKAAHDGKFPTPLLKVMVPVSFDGRTLVLASNHEFAVEWLTERHLEKLNNLLRSIRCPWALAFQLWDKKRIIMAS